MLVDPQMKQTQNKINDFEYPIEPLWILSLTLPFIAWSFFINIFAITFFVLDPTADPAYEFYLLGGIYVLAIPVIFILNILRWHHYHYEFEEHYLLLKQGIIKKQTRQLHYGVIQNVIVKRGIFDRIFGLSSVVIQNASATSQPLHPNYIKRMNISFIGFFDNTISIPGLRRESAEIIRDQLLKEIEESPIEEIGI